MQPIVSGTTTERIVRTTLLTILVNGFAIAFLWDGYVGYARENAGQLIQSLGLDLDTSPPINQGLTAAKARQIVDEIERAGTVTAVKTALGKPTIERGGDAFYLAPGGHLHIRLEQSRVTGIEWVDGAHTETDQAMQRLLGQLMGLVGLALLCQFVRVITTRVSLTDTGLKVRGMSLIPFTAMTTLRASSSGKTGLVHLEYTRNGRKGVLRLDNYVIKRFDAMIGAICEQTGFPDPRQTIE
jgi:hypothetical protein